MFHLKHYRIICIVLILCITLFPIKSYANSYTIEIPQYQAYGEYPLLALLLMCLGLVASGDVEVELLRNDGFLGMSLAPSVKEQLQNIIDENPNVVPGSSVELTVEEMDALRAAAVALNGQEYVLSESDVLFLSVADVNAYLHKWALTIDSQYNTIVDEYLEFIDNVTIYHRYTPWGTHQAYVIISENPAVVSNNITTTGATLYLLVQSSGTTVQESTGLSLGLTSDMEQELLNAQSYSAHITATLELIDSMISSGDAALIGLDTTAENIGTTPISVTIPITINYPLVTDSLTDVQEKVVGQTGVVPVPDIADLDAVGDAIAIKGDFYAELAAYQIPLLMRKMPFCLITDMVRIIGMFVQEPVTPELHFDLPISIDDKHNIVYYHVNADLHDWDDAAATLRFWETVGFLACFLIMLWFDKKEGGSA